MARCLLAVYGVCHDQTLRNRVLDGCRPKEPSQQRSGSPVHDEDVFNGVFTVSALRP
jgi:hypothetical protein